MAFVVFNRADFCVDAPIAINCDAIKTVCPVFGRSDVTSIRLNDSLASEGIIVEGSWNRTLDLIEAAIDNDRPSTE